MLPAKYMVEEAKLISASSGLFLTGEGNTSFSIIIVWTGLQNVNQGTNKMHIIYGLI